MPPPHAKHDIPQLRWIPIYAIPLNDAGDREEPVRIGRIRADAITLVMDHIPVEERRYRKDEQTGETDLLVRAMAPSIPAEIELYVPSDWDR